MTKVLICDDQEVVREGLRAILGDVPGIEVVGLASHGAEALEAVGRLHPDVVLMDLNMPIMNGVQATREIAARHPDVRVLVLTTYDAEEWVLDAIRAGASGYLLKDAPRERLVEAVRDTAAGKTPVDPAVAGDLFARLARPGRQLPATWPIFSAIGSSRCCGCSARVSPTPTSQRSCSFPRAPCATTSALCSPNSRLTTGRKLRCWRSATGWWSTRPRGRAIPLGDEFGCAVYRLTGCEGSPPC